MMPTDKIEHPKGFTCECGKFHEFGAYVTAHWRDILHHTCDDCGAKHSVVCGFATLRKRGKVKKVNHK
jgi:hypothetical protein